MNKRKILILTVVAIALFRARILIGSKIMTRQISAGNETENNLSADIPESENNGEIAFNYPYGTPYTMTDSDFMDVYKREIDLERLAEYVKKDNNPPADGLQYQDIANRCGEVIKYIYGYTAHSNNPAIIAFHPDYNPGTGNNNCFAYEYMDGTAWFSAEIDGKTGKIVDIRARENVNISYDESIKKDYVNETPPDELMIKLHETVLNDLEILGYTESTDTIQFFNTSLTARSGYDWYNISAILSNGESCSMGYRTVDNEYFELGRFYIN